MPNNYISHLKIWYYRKFKDRIERNSFASTEGWIIGGGPKGMLAPLPNYWGGQAPPGPPSSYAYDVIWIVQERPKLKHVWSGLLYFHIGHPCARLSVVGMSISLHFVYVRLQKYFIGFHSFIRCIFICLAWDWYCANVGWFRFNVVWGLTALWDSISVYIWPSPRERERKNRETIDARRNAQTTPNRPLPY